MLSPSATWASTRPAARNSAFRNLIANTTGIDVFIDGHSHSVINGETVKNKAGKDVISTRPAPSSPTSARSSSTRDRHHHRRPRDKVDSGTNKTVALAASIEAEYKDYHQVVAKSESVLVATNDDGSWAVRNKREPHGDLVADAYRIVMGADIGLGRTAAYPR